MRTSSSTSAIMIMIMGLIMACCVTLAAHPAWGESAGRKDKLSQILKRGKIIVATHPESQPRSQIIKNAPRKSDTLCFSNEYTLDEFYGYDIDVARIVAERLGVEPCFVTPAWYEIIGGRWADRWDVAIASLSITSERMESLYYARPYISEPAIFYVHEDNERYRRPADLSGKRIGTCAGCIFEYYLEGSLTLPGQTLDHQVRSPEIIAYDPNNLNNLFRELAAGDGVKIDAVLADIFLGSEALAEGAPIKPLGEPLFYTHIAPAFDRKQGDDPMPLIKKINEIIDGMHADGALARLAAERFRFDVDVITPARDFDFKALEQY